MRIVLMDVDVTVDDGRGPQVLNPQDGLFLRALALAEKTVTYEVLQELLGYKDPKTAQTYKHRLSRVSSALATAINSRRRQGYILSPQPDWFIDALQFKTTVVSWRDRLREKFYDEIDPDLAKEGLQALSEALDEWWHLNPASAFVDAPEPLRGLEHEYATLLEEAQLARNKCRVRAGTQTDIRAAIRELDLMTAEEHYEETWHLLIGAHAQLGRRALAHSVFQQASEAFESEPPARLLALIEQIRGEHYEPIPSSRPGILPGPIADVTAVTHELISVAEQLGILPSSSLSMRGSRLEPVDCIKRTRSCLYFSGVLASKWVLHEEVRREFEGLLSRLDEQDGQSPIGDVRFLIMNPARDAYRRLHLLRRGALSARSVPILWRLDRDHPSFQVRMFDSLPAFRIIVMDDDVVTFSPYRLTDEAYLSSRHGWEVPQVVLDPYARWPLAAAFRLYFLESWHPATPISKIDPDQYRS